MTHTNIEIEHCTVDDIGLEITGADAPPLIAALNEYLSAFAKPIKSDREGGGMVGNTLCLKCGETLDGILGTFQWGLAHGEGTCSKCGWPARAYHRPKDNGGEEMFNQVLEMILQYHPENVESR